MNRYQLDIVEYADLTIAEKWATYNGYAHPEQAITCGKRLLTRGEIRGYRVLDREMDFVVVAIDDAQANRTKVL